MTTELYRIYRPKKLSELVGQDETVKILEEKLKTKTVPHALLLVGNSGCGKTSTARILREELNCENNTIEINAAESRGIDTIRQIKDTHKMSALGGGNKMYIIDECHRLTGDAQSALLKMLEDCPSHVYFILCTTDPQDLLPTIKTRCTQFNFKPIADLLLQKLLADVIEKATDRQPHSLVTKPVMEKITEVSGGSARQALVILQKILYLETVDEQLRAIEGENTQKQVEFIAKLLMKKRPWKEISQVLKQLKENGDDPEQLRRAIRNYATAIVLNSGDKRAYFLLEAFDNPLYNNGLSGLVQQCYFATTLE